MAGTHAGGQGREVGGKWEETERNAGVMRGRETGEESSFLMTFYSLFKQIIKNKDYLLFTILTEIKLT